MKSQRNQAGFTLIELIAVIVILGILAAVALPKFVGMQQEARISAVNGLAGGMNSAAAIVKAKYMAVGVTTNTTVTMDDGSTVAVSSGTAGGVPTATAAGIGAALPNMAGFTPDYTATPITFRPTNGGGATCQVTYSATTGIASTVTTGC